jgi:membrane protein required for colicin V production
MSLGTLDWILLAVLLLSMLIGLWRGLVVEVLSVLGWIAAFVVAQMFASTVGQWLPMQGDVPQLRYATGFVLAFVGTLMASTLLAWLVRKMLASVGLSGLDRLLGAAFGAVRGAIILLAITTVVLMTPMKNNEGWRQSIGAGVLSTVLKGLKPVLPDELGKFISAAAMLQVQRGCVCVES